MKWLKIAVLTLIALIALVVAGLYVTGNGQVLRLTAGFFFGAPDGPFDPANAAPAPDYADTNNWAALPWIGDRSDRVPPGEVERSLTETAPVDVFFIHPTGFITGSSWTWSMDTNSKTEENTQWMLVNQASAYNKCCNVYAPRYRQANIFAYFSAEPDERDRILTFAYGDVERAFDHFINAFNEERPFIIASHSQGTHHGAELLRQRIDGTPLADRLVAAYLIGGGLTNAQFIDLKDIEICDAPEQTRCYLHWDTFSEQADDDGAGDAVCVNPLTWRNAGPLADTSQHDGAMPPSGEFQIDFFNDEATDAQFPEFSAQRTNYLHATCKSRGLYVTHQVDPAFGSNMQLLRSTNYHGLDYPLFYIDIRDNAVLRARTALQALSPDP